MNTVIEPALIDELRRYSTPSVLNGLKRLGLSPAQLEIMDRLGIQCMSPALGARIGFAATRKVATRRSGPDPGRERNREFNARMEQGILGVPAPRFLVVENVGDWQGPVCIWGEVMANINLAMGCTAGVTNGPVRDLPEMEAAGFQTFAGGPGTGGGFVDLLEVGESVVVGGLTVHCGDLIHADRHGVVKVPIELAADLPGAMRAVDSFERRIIAVCQSPDFSLKALAEAWNADCH
jgi:regulator of RNase E activity RraA